MKTVEIRKILEGIINFVCPDDVRVENIAIDSRNVKPGDIFFGLKGERTDGNLYAEDAIAKGAQLVVLDSIDAYQKISMNKIYVKDTLTALKSLGEFFINRYKGKIIGITGSVGKTTTKYMLKDILGTSYRTYASYKNYNNELGVAISACNIDMSSKYSIFELGSNALGEISDLTNYIKPDLGIITLIGFSHIGRFGDQDTLAKEKMSISNYQNMEKLWMNSENSAYATLARRGVKLRYYGDIEDCDIQMKEISQSHGIITFIVNYKDKDYTFKIKHIYSHLAYNSMPCIAIALDEGVEYEAIYESLLNFEAVEKRGQLIRKNGLTIIDDSYNAGFQSIISSIQNLSKASTGKRVAVIGEMAEIEGFEDELYQELENVASNLESIDFVFCGEIFNSFKKHDNFTVVSDKNDAFTQIKDVTEGLILLKASRGQRFEEIVNALINSGVK